MNDTTIWATFIAAIISLISVIVNLFLTLRKNQSEYVTKNKMNWIKDFRGLIGEFLDLYIDREDKNKLLKVKLKIEPYLRDGINSYDNLINQLNLCIINKYNESDYCKLIKCSQIVIHEVWIRVKKRKWNGEKS